MVLSHHSTCILHTTTVLSHRQAFAKSAFEFNKPPCRFCTFSSQCQGSCSTFPTICSHFPTHRPSSPVAVSLLVCVQEDERLTACAATVTDACNPSCASIVENSNGDMSECEALGLICAVIQCCNVCVEETNAYGVCLMNVMQCGDTQCSSSSAESNAIAVTIVFIASMVGFGMWW